MIWSFLVAYILQGAAFSSFLFRDLIPSEFFLIDWYSNWWD